MKTFFWYIFNLNSKHCVNIFLIELNSSQISSNAGFQIKDQLFSSVIILEIYFLLVFTVEDNAFYKFIQIYAALTFKLSSCVNYFKFVDYFQSLFIVID